MHKIFPPIEEIIALTMWLTDKKFSAKLAESGIWVK
jgi:hypothetical protein